MTVPQFPIPEEYQDKLEYVDSLDQRSDDEILASITNFQPVQGEKNIWCFWNTGIDLMPKWCLRNVISWARLNGPDWSIRVLDSVPESPNYALNYIPAGMMPECFVNGTMDGVYQGQHSADFSRASCLYLYGGVYVDCSIMLFRKLQDICWDQLEDPRWPFGICTPHFGSLTLGGYFVACHKGNPFIKRWHTLFTHVWQGRTNHIGISKHPLLNFTFDIKRLGVWGGLEAHLSVDKYTIRDSDAQITAWQRLCLLEDAGDGFNSADYAREKILWLDYLPETLSMQKLSGPTGFQDPLIALSTRCDADPAADGYQAGYNLVWNMLADASMQKVWTGQGLMASPSLGALWGLEENEGKDNMPGTFGELLRYGSVHFAQKREGVRFVKPKRPGYAINKGLLEA